MYRCTLPACIHTYIAFSIVSGQPISPQPSIARLGLGTCGPFALVIDENARGGAGIIFRSKNPTIVVSPCRPDSFAAAKACRNSRLACRP